MTVLYVILIVLLSLIGLVAALVIGREALDEYLYGICDWFVVIGYALLSLTCMVVSIIVISPLFF